MSSHSRLMRLQAVQGLPLSGLLFLVVVLSALLSCRAVAQTSPDSSVGVDPKLTYSTTDLDSVDPMTGRLSVHIPLLQDHSQRGNLNFSYSVAWSGMGDWYQECFGYPVTCSWAPSSDPFYTNGLGGPTAIMDHGLGGLDGSGGTGFVDLEGVYEQPCINVVEAGVASHPVQGAVSTESFPPPDACPDGDTFSIESVDASEIQLKRLNNSEETAETVLTNPSGVQFHYLGALTSPQAYIQDADGNQMTVSLPTGASAVDFGTQLFQSGGVTTLQEGLPVLSNGPMWTMDDTLGRPWELVYSSTDFGSCPSGTTNAFFWTTPGVAAVNGGVRQFTFCYSTVALNTNFGDNGVEDDSNSYPFLTQVILPDGTSYGLHYDDGYGEITELDLPTGGKITYAYTTIEDPCDIVNEMRTITTRTVYDNVNPAESWNYNLDNSTAAMTVSNPLGGTTVYTHPSGNCNPVTTTSYSDKDGTLLKTDVGQYNQYADPFGWLDTLYYPTGTHTTWGTGSGAFSTQISNMPDPDLYSFQSAIYVDESPVTYTVPYGMTGSTAVSDGFNGTLSTTTTTYWAFTNPTSDYLAENLLNFPSETTVQSSGGGLCSDTIYTYDDTGYIVASEISTQHESVTPLGNNTTIQRHLFSGACQSSAPSYTTLTTYRKVYDTGMLQQTIDPNGNATTYAYSSTYSGAYPTAVTNALGQAANYTYDANTGLVTGVTDPNGQQTAYHYDDMLRPVEIDYPDFGQETWAATYSSNIYTGSTYTKKINAAETYSSTTTSDGLGRTKLVQVADPQGADFTATTYDPLGRVASVSNPYRSTTDPTYGVTSYAYDILGRMRLQCDQDNASNNVPCVPGASYKRWSYNEPSTGATVDVYDENGVHTRQTSDGAGRITKLLEADDSGTLDVETDYSYDGLNNLISVSQKGQSSDTPRTTRAFAYDSLSRLTSAANPESGTVTYGYDGNGNLTSRTDARGILSSYSYDGLNRLYAKSYSNGEPSVSLTYDTPSSYAYTANNANNFVGRESQVSTSVGGTVVTSKYISGYDPMGRETGYIECGYAGDCASGTAESAFSADYYYDLAGNVITLNTGIGQLGELYPENSDQTQYRYFSYDAVNRLATAEANTDLSPGSQDYQVTNYNAFGKTTAADFPDENGTPQVNIARVYDNRMRLYFEDDAGPYFGLYAYGLSLQENNDVEAVNDSVMGNWTASYDTKNRMKSMTVYTAGPYYGLTLGWTYDSFGNRLTQTPSGTYTGSVPAAQSLGFNANNQIASGLTTVAYDAAGNVTDDGTNKYHYDAEGRICAVYAYNGSGAMTAYVYDGDGNRVAKEALTSFSCDRAANGFTLSNAYIVGLSGEQLEEADANGNEVHSNTFANGQLLYTYDDVTSEWTVALHDWLGTKRVQVDPAVLANVTSFQSLPFGDGLTSNGYDATEQHFTGKVRDLETGNDYFGARYYGSNMGRFTSPDEAFANFDQKDPQSFNMYSYVENNPLSATDPDGHNVQVCADNGNGGQNCVNLTDDQYKQLYQQQNGQQGINLPGGSMPGGNITCGGQVCGSAHFYEPGLQDESGSELMGIAGGMAVGKVVGAVTGAVAGWFGRGAAEEGGVVLGRTSELGEGALGPGERTLNLPDLGDPKANWAQNSSRLREAMAEGKPIRDAHVDGAGNLIRDNPSQGGGGAFLKAERNVLENHGWTYNPSTTSWYPPNK